MAEARSVYQTAARNRLLTPSSRQCWPLAVDNLAAGWLTIGAAFVGLMAAVGLYCKWALLRLDKEDAAADARQKGIL